MQADGQDLGATGPASAETIAAELKRRLFDGAYAMGQRLVEMDLAEEFDVGRSRVREAFRMLVGEGYLAFVANRGVLVRCFTREELIAMGRVREMLEGLAARLAAERDISDAERARLFAAQAEMDAAEAAGDLVAFDRANRAYHRIIINLAGNDHVGEFVDRVRMPLVRLQLPPSFSVDAMPRSNRDHRVITAAILSGSGDAAEAAMRAHVRAGNAHIASLPDDAFEPARPQRNRTGTL